MASTFPLKPNVIQGILGKDGSGNFYTVVPGTFVYKGTDGAGVPNRIVPCTDTSEHVPIGAIYAGKTADIEDYTKNGEVSIAIWPFVMNTSNVAGGGVPEVAANKLVYLLDAGTLSDTDTNTSLWILGQCVDINTGNAEPYTINFYGPWKV